MLQSASKIKILIVVPSLICGGVQRTAAVLCNYMDTVKYEVTLVVLNNTNPFFQITNKEIKIIDMGIPKVRNSLFPVLKLTKYIKPDIILLTSNHLNLFFGIFKWLFPKKMKIIARESSIVSINNKRAPNPVFYDWLTRVFYKKIDLVVCQSEYMQHDLVKNYNIKIGKTTVIYNAVIPVLLNVESISAPEFVRFIAVSRLSEEKGLDRLIRAVSHIKIPYQFTIIGEGDMHNRLQALINELALQQKIFLTGRKELPFAEVNKPDLFLMGSYYEGFPNAMLEAIAAGIPVVAFNAPGGIAELVVNYENGIMVEGNDEQAFAEAIQKALDHKFDKKKMTESVLKRFNIDNIMEQWYELFESLK